MLNRFRCSAAVLAVLFVGALVTVGCVRRVPLTPAQNVTLSLNQALASVSATNKDMASDVISLNAAGFVKPDLTNSILNYNRLVAQAVIAGEKVQKGTLSDADKAAAVKAVLLGLKLPVDVAAFLTGPGSQAVAGLVTTINALQGLIGAMTGGK